MRRGLAMAIVSSEPFPGAMEQKKAFNDRAR